MAWLLQGASRIGPYHERMGTPNQDAYGHILTNDGLAMAVADGAGSLRDSAAGAQLAIDTALASMAEGLGIGKLEDVLACAMDNAREALLAEENAKTMGCTMVLALATKEAWAVAVVGDAFAVVEVDGVWQLYTSPPISEYANITTLITSDNYEVHTFGGCGTPTALGMASDGLAHSTLDGNGPVPGFWNMLVKWQQESTLDLHEIFRQMDSAGRLDDDTTLVLASTILGE